MEEFLEQEGTGLEMLLAQLFEVALQLNADMELGLRERGLTRARAELIWRLAEEGEMTHHALSKALNCSPRNVTGLVDPLEDGGFVRRVPHPSDRRAALVKLTAEGRKAAEAMRTGYLALAQRLFGDLSPEQTSAFSHVLTRVLTKLSGRTHREMADRP